MNYSRPITARIKETPTMIKEAIKEVFPPEVPPVLRWRLAVSAMCVTFILFMGWAVSPYGFARAADQNSLRSDVTDIQITLLEQSLFSAKESECTASDAGSRIFFQNRVLSLSRDYFRLARVVATIPPCRD